jgi:uncharacterized protein YoxC
VRPDRRIGLKNDHDTPPIMSKGGKIIGHNPSQITVTMHVITLTVQEYDTINRDRDALIRERDDLRRRNETLVAEMITLNTNLQKLMYENEQLQAHTQKLCEIIPQQNQKISELADTISEITNRVSETNKREAVRQKRKLISAIQDVSSKYKCEAHARFTVNDRELAKELESLRRYINLSSHYLDKNIDSDSVAAVKTTLLLDKLRGFKSYEEVDGLLCVEIPNFTQRFVELVEKINIKSSAPSLTKREIASIADWWD